MRLTFLTLSAACAALSVAEAIPAPRPHEDGPKHYFPRVVKRQADTNGTTLNPPVVAEPTTKSSGGLGDALATVIGSVASDLNTALNPTTTAGIIVGVDTVITNDPTTGKGPTSSIADPADDPKPTPTPTLTPTPKADPTPIDTPQPVTTTKGLGDAVSSVLESLTSGLGQTTEPQPTPTPIFTPTPTPIFTPTLTDGPTAGPPTTTGLGDIISSLTSALDPITNLPITTTGLPDPITNLPITTTGLPDPPITTAPPPPVSTTNPPTISDPPTQGPTNPVTTTPPQDPPTQQPTTPITTPPVSDPPTQPPPVQNNNTNTDPPTQPPSLTPTLTPSEPPVQTQPPTTTPASKAPPQSIIPTGTDNATAVEPPSTIATAPPVPSTPSDTKTVPTTQPTTMPSDVPRVITPEGGIPVAPENSTLIQIAFKEALHYEFVVGSQLAVSQIFTFLPQGIAGALTIGENKVVMQYLQPYNTLAKLHYITTLCMGYVPTDQIDKLSLDMLNTNSPLFESPNKSVKTLMNMIDPSVPLLAGQGLTPGGTPVDTTGGTNTNNNGNEDGAPGGDGGGSGVKPSSVGIAVGAVAGAAVYGAAMFLVARRYKKRKAAHQRASSVQTDETPRPGEGTNLMAGARNSYGSRVPGHMNSNNAHGGRGSRNSDRSDESGRSGRTYISPPVMAENSLGWN